jgi:hypothetical protein
MRTVGKAIGYLLSALGLGIFIFGMLGLIDPGTQQANDSDPFGVPPSAAQIFLHMAFGFAMLIAGFWLVVRNRRV